MVNCRRLNYSKAQQNSTQTTASLKQKTVGDTEWERRPKIK